MLHSAVVVSHAESKFRFEILFNHTSSFSRHLRPSFLFTGTNSLMRNGLFKRNTETRWPYGGKGDCFITRIHTFRAHAFFRYNPFDIVRNSRLMFFETDISYHNSWNYFTIVTAARVDSTGVIEQKKFYDNAIFFILFSNFSTSYKWRTYLLTQINIASSETRSSR